MENNQPKQTPFSQKSVLLQHFQQHISKTMPLDKDSTIMLYEIQRLDHTARAHSLPQTYLLELIITEADGSYEFKKIVLKRLTPKTLISGNVKLQSKDFSMIQSVQIPRIIHSDFDSGYVLKEFIHGKEVAYLLGQIVDQGYIKNWQKKVFEKIGQGIAEIHTKLKIIHSDPILINWIYTTKTDNLSLIDWEWAGRGDPAYDLSRLIYDIGRHVSQLKYCLGLKKTNEIYDVFNAICLAIINGYTNSSKNREIIRKSASFWIHYSFSVTARIHEIIFQCCGFPIPKTFMFLRRLPDSFLSYMIKKDQTTIRKILGIFTRLISLTLLVSGKRNRKEISHKFKKLTQMFRREMKK